MASLPFVNLHLYLAPNIKARLSKHGGRLRPGWSMQATSRQDAKTILETTGYRTRSLSRLAVLLVKGDGRLEPGCSLQTTNGGDKNVQGKTITRCKPIQMHMQEAQRSPLFAHTMSRTSLKRQPLCRTTASRPACWMAEKMIKGATVPIVMSVEVGSKTDR